MKVKGNITLQLFLTTRPKTRLSSSETAIFFGQGFGIGILYSCAEGLIPESVQASYMYTGGKLLLSATAVSALPLALGASLPAVAGVAATSLAAQGIALGAQGVIKHSRCLKSLNDTVAPVLPLVGNLVDSATNGKSTIQNITNATANLVGGIVGSCLAFSFFKPSTQTSETEAPPSVELLNAIPSLSVSVLSENQIETIKEKLKTIIQNGSALSATLQDVPRKSNFFSKQKRSPIDHVERQYQTLEKHHSNDTTIGSDQFSQALKTLSKSLKALKNDPSYLGPEIAPKIEAMLSAIIEIDAIIKQKCEHYTESHASSSTYSPFVPTSPPL